MHTQDELALIRERGEAPLVRLRQESDGYPIGTLGCIVGVQKYLVVVHLAGSALNDSSLLLPQELENVT